MGPALRIDVLDDIIVIAKDGVDRLCAKLEPLRGTGKAIDVNEEFRLLTLQVWVGRGGEQGVRQRLWVWVRQAFTSSWGGLICGTAVP